MIYQIPNLQQADREVLGLIHKQRAQLQYLINQNPVRWTGSLRRNTFAHAVQGCKQVLKGTMQILPMQWKLLTMKNLKLSRRKP